MNAAEDTVVTDPISRVATDRQMDNIADGDHTSMAMEPSGAPEQPQAHSTVPPPPSTQVCSSWDSHATRWMGQRWTAGRYLP